jgi:hypothetical protein
MPLYYRIATAAVGPWVEAQAALDTEAKPGQGTRTDLKGGPRQVAKAERGTRDNIRRRLERQSRSPVAMTVTLASRATTFTVVAGEAPHVEVLDAAPRVSGSCAGGLGNFIT